MPNILNASSLTLGDVYRRFPLERQTGLALCEALDLEPLSDLALERLTVIREHWVRSLTKGKLDEGTVKFLAISPLLMEGDYLADPDVETVLEEKIAEIAFENDGAIIRGRMDILVFQNPDGHPSLCLLIIETKNSTVNVLEGLPQLLIYMHTFLDRQKIVWGLLTTGTDYTFVRLQHSRYQIFKSLNFLFPDDSEMLLKALVAIRKLQPEPVD